MKPTFGIEEEVFVVEPYWPGLDSLYYLSRFLWKNPLAHYRHSASNFCLSGDISKGLMAGIEISTPIHTDVDELIEDLNHKRKLLAESCDGLILPLGSLITDRSSSRTCAWQIHIGGVKNLRRAYANLVFYLPLLKLLMVNAPFVQGRYFGQSFRMHYSFAVGPLISDWSYRFQDIIYSRRLKTIEIRVFDPIWDMERIKLLLELIRQIILSEEDLPLDIKRYNELREKVITTGYDGYLFPLYRRMRKFADLSEDIFRETCSSQIRTLYERYDLLGTYTALDNAYRTGRLTPRPYNSQKSFRILKKIYGLLTYYIPKLPFAVYKTMREK